MFSIEISEDYAVYQEGSSEGTQVKYRKDGYWYKIDKHGEEGLVEYLVSNVLKFSTLNADEYVLYDAGTINGKTGCASKDFLKCIEDSFVTFQRIYKNVTGCDLTNTVNNLDTLEERFEFVLNFLNVNMGYDATHYLQKILTVDFLSLNTDRHFNNLGFIVHKDGTVTDAPIFDNGQGLLNGNVSINKYLSIAENTKRVVARPFSGSHRKMLDYVGVGFDLDVDGAKKWVQEQPQTFYRDVLLYQLEQWANLLEKPTKLNI
ncbi:MAG: hypothetical protein NC309_13030 [Ruminococcus sp.]|nr:hypothetical protein [Clostridium sp.]MCM1209838.1 hypothetical protein [Ruminococcus sp.]